MLYHGFDMPEGRFAIDILDCDPVFIRTVINERHGTSFGADYGARPNDKIIERGTNPLLVAADIFKHLIERPERSIWHNRVNQWAV